MALKVKIRVMFDADVGQMISLNEQFGFPSTANQLQERFAQIKTQSHHEVFVAEVDPGKVIGWVHVYQAPSLISEATCEGGGLVVDQEYRNQGVGQRLVRAAEEWARLKGCQWGLLATHTDRKDAHRFYQSLGFETLFTTYFMRKKLDKF